MRQDLDIFYIAAKGIVIYMHSPFLSNFKSNKYHLSGEAERIF